MLISCKRFVKIGYNFSKSIFPLGKRQSKNESVSFSFNFWKKSRETGGYTLENEVVEVGGVTTNKVLVIYSNKDEGEYMKLTGSRLF